MSANPFDVLRQVEPVKAAEAAEVKVPANAIMVFDFETVPDESRFPPPKSDPNASTVPDLDLDQFFTICSTVADVSNYLKANRLSVEQYDRLYGIEKSGKGRATVTRDIRAAKESAMSEFTDWVKECSTNPLKARIVAFGWALGNGPVESMIAENDDQERSICEKFWQLVRSGRRRAGYNITGFDDMLIGVRSLLLGVTPSIKLARKKYGNHQALDLMTLLFPNSSAQKLKEVCAALKIDVPAGDMDGSKVFDLYREQKWGEIANYVESDVQVERELMWKLLDVFAEQ